MQLFFNVAMVILLLINIGITVAHTRTIRTFGQNLTAVRKENQHGS